LVERELAQHDERLAQLPCIVALSKSDLVTEESAEETARKWKRELQLPVVAISSVTRFGLDNLVNILYQKFDALAPTTSHPTQVPPLDEHRVYRPKSRRSFQVEQTGDHQFTVMGEGIDRLVARYDLDNEEALAYVEQRLRSIGVIDALENEGFQPGDEVVLGSVTLELTGD
jgi:GTP-binding protein